MSDMSERLWNATQIIEVYEKALNAIEMNAEDEDIERIKEIIKDTREEVDYYDYT